MSSSNTAKTLVLAALAIVACGEDTETATNTPDLTTSLEVTSEASYETSSVGSLETSSGSGSSSSSSEITSTENSSSEGDSTGSSSSQGESTGDESTGEPWPNPEPQPAWGELWGPCAATEDCTDDGATCLVPPGLAEGICTIPCTPGGGECLPLEAPESIGPKACEPVSKDSGTWCVIWCDPIHSYGDGDCPLGATCIELEAGLPNAFWNYICV